ncbi:hypothetical protein DdX_08194 [Ditylenchus destructor]|uniref:Uncharacterized protein n=1 Tax=Ditylenchus destructor TaxID=166010 RepID=A0AAD4N4N3_9BILA|nr:hypothetical protein DdX_08194 [Ditylenchus destructor]
MFCWAANGGHVPNYLLHYPFSPVLIAKLYCITSSILMLVIWFQIRDRRDLHSDYNFISIAIADLISLLFFTISLWFALQKFFWVKLETVLNMLSLFFTSIAILATLNIDKRRSNLGNQVFYLLVPHFYMALIEMFALIWVWKFTRNTVSNLFINNWGAETNYCELRQLDRDF